MRRKENLIKVIFYFSVFLLFTVCSLTGCTKDPNGTDEPDIQEQDFHEDCTRGAKVVEIELNGEKVLCFYVDGRYIVEGDIVIKDDNIKGGDSISTSQGNITTRAASDPLASLWPEGKVYYINDLTGLNDVQVNNLFDARGIITSANPNIHFISLNTVEALNYKKNFIVFISDTANLSSVGMQPSHQYLRLHITVPSALHELGHTLGLIHEHSRFDRDTYLEINRNNYNGTDDAFFINFGRKYDKYVFYSKFSKDFDYESIMMYSSVVIGSRVQNGIELPVITRKDGVNGGIIKGKRNHLTAQDINVLNQMYPKLDVVTPDFFIHKTPWTATTTTCELTGELIFEGVPAITEYGICYIEDKTGNFELKYQPATSTESNGLIFKCTLPNLKPNTQYKAQAYVKQNGKPLTSGEIVTFTTKSVQPSKVSTVAINGITETTANVDANVTDAGNPPYTERGICWSTHANTTINDKKNVVSGSGQTGSYSSMITGLTQKTTYYAKAYVIQNNTPIYGNEIRFTTAAKPEESSDWVLINGVKWATRNVGAPGTFVANPEDYGGYYQWNRGTTDMMLAMDYYYSSYINSTTWLPANDPSPAGYRVPTLVEIQSLTNATYVTFEWTTRNGVYGGRFTDRASGKSIFLPATGWRGATIDNKNPPVLGVGSSGGYYSNTQYVSDRAYFLHFENGNIYLADAVKAEGLSVRPIAK